MKQTSYENQFYWTQLYRTRKVTPQLFFRLIEIFHNPKRAVENLEEFSIKSGCKQPIKPISKSIIQQEFENCLKIKASIITFQDENYPSLLKEIADPPPLITIKGNPELLNKNIISIIGTRNSSSNGDKFANHISTELGKYNFIIASGMARGIDSAAHLGALRNGTIAVIAGGIDHIYPKENKKLYHEICEKGVVISEAPHGFFPKGYNFPQRNRIISGISLGIAVIEATIKSGTLITARFAIEHNRDLFSVPGSPLDPRHHGTNRLIKEGAFMLQSYLDIVKEVKPIKKDLLNFAENDEYKTIDQPPKIPDDKSLQEAAKIIMNKINFTPIKITEIIQQCDLPIRLVNIALTQLELADKIENIGGKICLKMT